MRLTFVSPLKKCSWSTLLSYAQLYNEFSGNVVNQVKEFFVKEIRKYFILRNTSMTKSPHSI